MSRRKSGAGAFESTEDDLLNDGGASAFKIDELEDDEIDEEALLGLGDDDGGDASYLLGDVSGADMQDTFGSEQAELLEIGVDEEEINELGGEEEGLGTGTAVEGEEEVEQLDYVDDLPQAEDQEVHVEYDENIEVSTSEADLSQEEGQRVSFTQSLSETPTQAVTDSKESESESEDSDGEKTGRGRFKSERSNIITIGKAKSRTDIPDTLEVSAEQQAQIDQFPDRRQRDRNRADRGRGRYQQRGGFRGNRQDRNGNQRSGGPIRVNLGYNHHQQGGHFGPGQMGSPPRPMGGRQGGPMPRPGDRPQGGLFGAPPGVRNMGPQPLMGVQMAVPNQGGGFNMTRPPPLSQGGTTTLIRGPPTSMAAVEPTSRPMFQQPPQLSQPSVFRPGVPVSGITSRPHTIHINPNFRGSVPSSMAPASQARPFSQPTLSTSGIRQHAGPPVMGGGERPVLGQGPVRPGMPGQPQRFPQPQGFQQRPRMGGPPNQPGGNVLPGQQRQGPRFGSSTPGQGGLMDSPVRHPATPAPGFPGQGLPPPQLQNPPPFSGFGSPPPTSMSMSHPPVQQFTPQQGLYRGPTPQQQLQQQQTRPGVFQHRVGVQPQRGVTPQNRSSVTMARKLSQQARNLQKAKVATQTINKNITVVPLKRQSTGDEEGGPSPNKVAKVADGPLTEDDLELRKGLEEQKRLREMIRKRKEEARRKQAEERRRELESRLQEKGISLDDIEGKSSEELQSSSQANADIKQGAQRIKTVVTRGGKKHLVTSTGRAQQISNKPQVHQQQQLQQQQPRQEFAQHAQGPPPSSAPPGQFQGPPVQQPPPMFSQPPPMHQPPPNQQQLNPRFSSQQFPPPRFSGPPPTRPPTPGPQISPVGAHPPPASFRQPNRPVGPGPLQSPRVVRQGPPPSQPPPGHNNPPMSPQQQFSPHSSSMNTVNVVRHVQHANNGQAVSGVGRGTTLAMARGGGRGQVVQGRGQAVQGRGQVMMRGRGQAQGRGQAWGRGGAVMAGGAQPVVVSSPPSPRQAASNRTVLPLGRGRMVTRGGAVAPTGGSPAPGRTVVQRQVVAHPAPANAKVQQRVASAGGGLQKVSVDNLAMGTTEQQIRQGCEACGPVLGIVMLESQRKAIVTFASKMHAVLFAKQWNRRIINMSVVTVTLLP